MRVTYGAGFPLASKKPMRERVEALQAEVSKLPQYEPETKHYFHAGMYCREVFRDAGVLVIGKVHKKEHFYLIVSGTVRITDGDGVQVITGPHLMLSKPGTKRAVYSETPALCMTFHKTDSANPEEAELELVEPDDKCMYTSYNKVKSEVLT